ncbi:MAG: Bcr/CflA family drug resistance efflux transporter [Ahrensia sp.]|nr:Bcr/CflA family drug resistance efflux transporter [Ahrensia sp.]
MTLVAVTGVAAMAMNIFLPSLPRMAAEFGTEYSVIQLSVALYLALTGATQIVLGPLADRFGRRPVLLAAYFIFVVASLGCIVSTNVVMFLGFRMLQAVVFSGVVLARTVVRDTVAEASAASRIAYLSMGMAAVPMFSPALGGILDSTLGWRASFWVMFLYGGAALWLIWRDVGETRPHAFASFAEQFRGYPELLTAPRFWGYGVVQACSAGTFFAYLGGAPFVGTQVFGLGPVALGLFFGASSVGYVTGSFISGRFSARAGVLRMVFVGTLTSTLALIVSLALFLAGFGSVVTFFGLMFFVAIGYGTTLPNATVGMLSVRPHLAGTASGLGSAMMILGGAALSAYAGAVMVPGAGAERLVAIQLASSLVGVAGALFVLFRQRALAAQS